MTRGDWTALAEALERQWKAMDAEVHRYHKGLFEGYVVVAREMRDSDPTDRDVRLWTLLWESLPLEQAMEVI